MWIMTAARRMSSRLDPAAEHLRRSQELSEELDVLVDNLQQATLDLRQYGQRFKKDLTKKNRERKPDAAK